MQTVAATTTIVNDTGLVSAEQIPAFRAYLEESGLQVRDAGAGQFFHVRWQYSGRTRWLPIERGRAGAPVTPQLLRPLVDRFLKNPLDRAVGEVRAERQAAERAVAREALAQPTVVEALPGYTAAFKAQVEAPVRAALEAIAPFIEEPEAIKAPAAQLVSDQDVALASTADAQYLSDLRDDFALHAPITLPMNATAQDMVDNAVRRWQYADLMMAARTAKAGD